MTAVEALDVLVEIARDAAGDTAMQCEIDEALQVLLPLMPKEQICPLRYFTLNISAT